MQSNKEITLSLSKIYSNSNSEHNIYTPLDLCNKILNSIQDLSGDILVISNLEFLIQLKNKITLDKVYYATDCELKRRVAMNLGININNIFNLQYKKEVIIDTDMKFDIVVQNPPYNPNALWKKFVEKGINMLKDDGKMVAIHPAAWREVSTHKKLYNILIKGIEELHICDYENFKDDKVATKTDWYLYNKSGSINTHIFYSNEDEIIDLKLIERIFRFSTKSIPYSIIKKICTTKDNNIIFEKGFNDLYKPENHSINGKYKQCGGSGNGTGWTDGNFVLTDKPSKHQFEDKVVMSYAGKPRAQFFSKDDEVGSVRAHYWLTNNQSLPILLNSKMLWKLICKIVDPDENMYKPYGTVSQIPAWILRTLNFERLIAKNEEELYKHYKLTTEEIEWINN